MYERTRRLGLAWGLAAALAGCGDKAGAPDSAGTAVVGSAGGTVTDPGGASVVVPAGAFEGETTLRIAKDSTGSPPLPSGLDAAGDTYVITPHGGEFASPVEVRIPAPGVTLQPNQELKLAKAQPGGEWVILGDSALQDGVLSAQVGNFSFFVPVVVSYLVPLVQAPPLAVTSMSLDCGGEACNDAVGELTATYTVTTNSGALPENCSSGTLKVYDGTSSYFSASTGSVPMALSGGAVTRRLFPWRGRHNFIVGLSCGTSSRLLGRAFVDWRSPPNYPDLLVMRTPAQLDVLEGTTANLEVVMAGGAAQWIFGAYTPPSLVDRALVDWQRSDDDGGSWRTIARSYQDEANPNPAGGGFPWYYWSIHHGVVASPSDQGALIRVHACYTPPDVPAPPCVTGPATRINVLQDGPLPTITTQPASLAVMDGSDAAFAVVARGIEPLTYAWRLDGAPIAGATGPLLRLAAVTSASAGAYTVLVSDAGGSVLSEAAILTVSPGAPADVAPTIVTQPVSVLVNAGNTATFAVGVSGSGPLAYQWRRDGVAIPGATAAFLAIDPVAVADGGTYAVVVSNAAGSETSWNVTLTVLSTPEYTGPAITTQPAAQVALPGGTAIFAVAVSGSGPISHQWSHDGTPIPGATSAVLELTGLTGADAGSYTVTVGNLLGSVTSAPATLTLIGAPFISAQPVAVTVTAGAAATFTVAASGSALSYQWLRDGATIPGATAATYTTPALTLSDHGAVYGVVISNGAGVIFSQTAVLSVVAAVSVGGTVGGLTGAGLVLQNNAGDDLAVVANGSFTFATAIPLGTTYSVTILSQPSGQRCAIQGGSGTASAAVTSVLVTCTSASALALVANSGANTLSVMRVDAGTGALTGVGAPVATGQYPYDVAISPSGQFAYVGNLVSGTISSYGIDAVTGVLTPIPLSTPGTQNPYGIAMDPLGRFLWVANYGFSTASTFAIDPGTGVLTAVGAPISTVFPYDLAIHPSGSFVYVANEASRSISVFSVDASTGALTLVAGTIANSVLSPHGLAVDPSGRFLYAASAGAGSVAAFRIDQSTGALTVVGYVNSGSSPESVAVHPNGQFVYVVNQSSKDVAIFSINQTTGALTSAGPTVAAGSGPRRLAVDAAGSHLYVTDFVANSVLAFSIGAGGATLTSLGAAAAVGSAPEGVALTP